MATNRFSADWYEIFLRSIKPSTTDAEIAFIERQMPADAFPNVLDLACGPGRHASRLTERGYTVTGVDVNKTAIEEARRATPAASFEVLDMRDLGSLEGLFEGVVSLWHSFGFFDDTTNLDILLQIHALMRPGGRVLFDLYNDRYLAHSESDRQMTRRGVSVNTQHVWSGNRLSMQLAYDDESVDHFDWRIYSETEFRELCVGVGFRWLLSCAWFDESLLLSEEHSRMQLLFEKSL